MRKDEEDVKNAYDENSAKQYHFTRAESNGVSGFHCREIERPMMFKLVSQNLEGKVLLDAGCGSGIHLQEYLKRGCVCYGVDISEDMIKLAKENCPESNLKVGSVYDLEFPDETFDIVTASLVYTCVEDLDSAFKEIKRVLKSDGLFIFTMTHPINYMFRDSEKDVFVPTHDYFDKSVLYRNIAKSGEKFPDYCRTMQDYFRFFLDNGFILRDFVENETKYYWLERYPDLDTRYLKVPSVVGFKWEKT